MEKKRPLLPPFQWSRKKAAVVEKAKKEKQLDELKKATDDLNKAVAEVEKE
ncbi:MAG: hypothetical protein R2788_26310 [Saprospiraceae bacterium]